MAGSFAYMDGGWGGGWGEREREEMFCVGHGRCEPITGKRLSHSKSSALCFQGNLSTRVDVSHKRDEGEGKSHTGSRLIGGTPRHVAASLQPIKFNEAPIIDPANHPETQQKLPFQPFLQLHFFSLFFKERKKAKTQPERRKRKKSTSPDRYFLPQQIPPTQEITRRNIYIYIYILRPKKPRKEKSFWKNDVETCSAIFKTTSPDFIFVNSFFFLSLIIILLSLLFLFCYNCCLKFSRERFASNHRNETPDPRLEYYRVI